MKLLQRIGNALSAFRASPVALSHSTWGGGGPSSSDGFGTKAAPSDAELLNAFKGLAYACARLNANGVSRVPLRLYVTTAPGEDRPRSVRTRRVPPGQARRLREVPSIAAQLARTAGDGAEIEEVLEHPILAILKTPTRNPDSPFRGQRSLIHFAQLCQEIVGSSFWRFSLDGLGMPAEIVPLPPAAITPVPFAAERPDGRVIDHYAGPRGQKLAADEIAWFRAVSLANPYAAAYSPAEACFQELGLLQKFGASTATIFDRAFMPSAIVSAQNPDRPIGDVESERLEKDLNRKFTRARANGVIVARTSLNFDPWEPAKADVGGVEVSRSNKQIICNAFDVPLTMIETTDSNKASAGEGNKAHLVNAVSPRCEKLGEDLTGWMHGLAASDRLKAVHGPLGWERAFVAFDNPVPEDVATKGKTLVSFVTCDILRKDEARLELGYEPHEDGTGMDKPEPPAKPGDGTDTDDEDDDE